MATSSSDHQTDVEIRGPERLLRVLERFRSAAVVSLLIVHAGLLMWGASRHSPTENELAHLAAGISHWELGRFDLYRVNPPLVRMWASVPVRVAGAKTNWKRFDESPGSRSAFAVGRDFADANKQRSIWLCILARWSCVPLSLLGAYVCYRWASELFGAAAGLLALTLWCFSPNVLAHAELITPDAGAAAIGLTACYLFWRWLKRPAWIPALAAGLVLGLAELTKTTWIVLYLVWPLAWIFYQPLTCRRLVTSRLWSEALQLFVMLLVSVYTINQGYGFEGSMTRLGDFEFVSETLAGPAVPRGSTGNRMAGSRWAAVPVPLPKNYLMGIDAQRRDFEDFGRPSYLRGRWKERGWWYYYLYGLAVKVPLGTWLLGLLAVLLPPASSRKSDTWRDEAVLLLPALAVFTLASSQTVINHHFRYVLPAFPFVFVWISQVMRSVLRTQWKPAIVGAGAIAWSIGSSLSVYPHSLSYFNELAFGPRNGHAHLIHSSIDWGQDLLYLKRWLDEHPEAEPLQLAYYGHFDPRWAGIEFTLPPQAPADSPQELPSDLEPGWYAVSVNFLYGDPWHAPDGQGARGQLGKDAFSYFQQFEPAATAGFSIYIYQVEANDLQRRQQSAG